MPSRSDRTRRALAGLVAVSFALVVGACSSAATAPASAPTAPAPSPKAVDGTGSEGIAAIPAVAPASVGSGPAIGASGSGTAASGTAVAYPYYGGTPAVAPEHTIVVTGYGQATMAADGADRSKAQAKALAAALVDAREQADAIAKATGVTISGVDSVSASGGGDGYAVPMAVNGTTGAETPPAPGTDASAVPVPAATSGAAGGSSGSSSGGSATTPEPALSAPTTLDFEVSVTVAYSISG